MDENLFKMITKDENQDYFQEKYSNLNNLLKMNKNSQTKIEKIIKILKEKYKLVNKKINELEEDICIKRKNLTIFNSILPITSKNNLRNLFVALKRRNFDINLDLGDSEEFNFESLSLDENYSNFLEDDEDKKSEKKSIQFNFDLDDDEIFEEEIKKKRIINKKISINFYSEKFKIKNSKKKVKVEKKEGKKNKFEDYQMEKYYKKSVRNLTSTKKIENEKIYEKKKINKFLELNFDKIMKMEVFQNFLKNKKKNFKLIDYVKASNELNSSGYLQIVNYPITGLILYKFLREKINPFKKNLIWDKKKDKQLLDLIKYYGEENIGQIRLYFDNITPLELFRKIILIYETNKKWSQFFDLKLLYGVIVFEFSWNLIAEKIFKLRKNQIQCRERFSNSLDPFIWKNQFFKHEEFLITFLYLCGYQWSWIVKNYFPNCGDNIILRKFYFFKKHNKLIYEDMKKIVKIISRKDKSDIFVIK